MIVMWYSSIFILLTTDFLCPLTAVATDMMFWETGHMKIIKSKLSILHVVQSPFFPIERASKNLPGQLCHLRNLPGLQLSEKTNIKFSVTNILSDQQRFLNKNKPRAYHIHLTVELN